MKKVEQTKLHLEKEIRVDDEFTKGQFIDVLYVPKGHGYEYIILRYETKKL